MDDCHFWFDTTGFIDPPDTFDDDALIDHTRLLGPRKLADIYLLGLAVMHGSRLVTLDRSISFEAAHGASEANLVTVV